MPGNSNSIWQGLRCPLILSQEKSESARVYFLWETVSILKLGGCRLGVKGEIQALSLGSCCFTSTGSQSSGHGAKG